MQSIMNYFVFPTWSMRKEDFTKSAYYECVSFIDKIPYIKFEHESAKAIIIYYHGNQENIFNIAPLLYNLCEELECTIISYDYPGYSLYTDVSPSETKIYEDATTVYNHVLNRYANNEPKNIILIGRSLGSAPAIYTAYTHRNIKSLVLLSAFSSILGTLFKTKFSIDMFKNYSYIQYINTPTLFIHGKEDKVVPCRNSKSLHELIKNKDSKLVIFVKGTHNNLTRSKSPIYNSIIEEIKLYI